MNFDDLDRRMRVFETSHDHCVLPGIWMVARIDGRSFTRLTKERHQFEAPFDVRFRDLMVVTVKHLMTCGCYTLFGYTQSDEISLLLHRDETAFGRKLRKLTTVLAGEASAAFSLALGDIGAFDARISQLPSEEHVIDYFRWRAEDAARNALAAHCHWSLIAEGCSAQEATRRASGLSTSAKNELLFARGINFNNLPTWQKRGTGVVWEQVESEGFNPATGQTVLTTRRQLRVEYELPMKDGLSDFMRRLLVKGGTQDE